MLGLSKGFNGALEDTKVRGEYTRNFLPRGPSYSRADPARRPRFLLHCWSRLMSRCTLLRTNVVINTYPNAVSRLLSGQFSHNTSRTYLPSSSHGRSRFPLDVCGCLPSKDRAPRNATIVRLLLVHFAQWRYVPPYLPTRVLVLKILPIF